jgi:hypothetical protein
MQHIDRGRCASVNVHGALFGQPELTTLGSRRNDTKVEWAAPSSQWKGGVARDERIGQEEVGRLGEGTQNPYPLGVRRFVNS